MPGLNIETLPTKSLVPYARNARVHSPQQVKQIATSIDKFGFLVPVLIDSSNQIIAGHGRIMAANKLKMRDVPCIRIEHLTEAQKRAYIIADNKLTENASWNQEILALELKELSELDLDFSLDITGFHVNEIDLLIEGIDKDASDDEEEDEIIDIPVGPPISKAGDIWQLGKHRIYCGNSLEEQGFQELLANKKATMVITDPPYNVPIDGHVCGKGSAKHNEFVMASGEMSQAEFTRFLQSSFEFLRKYSTEGSIHYIFMDWRHMQEILTAGTKYHELKNLCVWVKDNGGMGTFYRSRHELVFVFKNGSAPHINNFELGQHGRYRSNVWEYAGINSVKARNEHGENLLDLHPTVKPINLLEDAIRDCSKRNDIVLDPFLGSGSTLLACEKSGRKCYSIEIEPKFVDVCIRRWEKQTGKKAEKISEHKEVCHA
ncbi:MAG: DNA methyltransferase [Alphaproteobacteria bacterium]